MRCAERMAPEKARSSKSSWAFTEPMPARSRSMASRIRSQPPSRTALGLAMVDQELSLAPHLSIHDNIWLGNHRVPFLHHRRNLVEEAASVMRLLGAADYDLRRPAGALSIGQRQIVEIARLIARDVEY